MKKRATENGNGKLATGKLVVQFSGSSIFRCRFFRCPFFSCPLCHCRFCPESVGTFDERLRSTADCNKTQMVLSHDNNIALSNGGNRL